MLGMFNFFDEDGNQILRDPAVLATPLGPWIAQETEYIGQNFSYHSAQCIDIKGEIAFGSQTYATSLSDYAKGFDSKIMRDITSLC